MQILNFLWGNELEKIKDEIIEANLKMDLIEENISNLNDIQITHNGETKSLKHLLTMLKDTLSANINTAQTLTRLISLIEVLMEREIRKNEQIA